MVELICGDARAVLSGMDAQSVHCCIASPPYFALRSYGGGAQEIGTEQTPAAYVAALADVFRGVWRVLRDDGTLWLVLGDSYAGSWGNQGRKPAGQRGNQRPINGPILQPVHDGRYPAREHNTGACPPGVRPKSLLGIPWRVAFALQDDGWILRQELIWAKPNPMPESVKDRCARAHETVFMLAKGPRYYYDQDAIREEHTMKPQRRLRPQQRRDGTHAVDGWKEPRLLGDEQRADGHAAGRNKRSVWTVATSPLSSKKYGCATEHYAAFPPELVRPMVRAATSERGVCPACGAPYRRVVERAVEDDRAVERKRNVGGRSDGFTRTKASGGLPPVLSQTTGWEPGCSCDAGEPVPAIVLDPFLGSGTTGLVALQEGRRVVGIDLNAAYIDLARARLAQTQPPLLSAV